MGLGAAIGGGLGLLAGQKATSSQPTSQQQSQQGSSQQSNSGPWVGAQPGLSTLYNAATENFYGGGPQYYPGQTVADQSWTTQHGLNMGQQAGMLGTQNMTGANALDQAGWLADRTLNGGMLYSNPAMGGFSRGSNFNANTMGGMAGLGSFGAGGQVGNTQGDDQLANVANGNMLNSNPYVDQMFNQAAGQVGNNFAKNVMPGVASMFAGAGRFGSEAMNNGMQNAQTGYGNQINNLASSIYGGNYANERGLQQGAMNQLNNAGLQERGQQLGALGTMTQNQLAGQGLQQSALQGMSGAYGNERSLQNSAMGQAPGLASADYNDVNALLGIGGQRDQYAQNQTNAAMDRWNFGQNANNNRLSFLNSIMSGAPQQSSSIGSSYGTSSGTSMQPGNPMAPLQGALMGGMLGQGMGSMFGPSTNPYTNTGVANIFRGY